MKKQIAFFALLPVILLFLESCGSTKIIIEETSPVALISVIGNTQVPWVDEDEETTPTGEPEAEGLLSSMTSKLTDSQNLEILTAVDRLDYACDSVNQILPEMTEFQLIPKESLLSSDAYAYLSPSYFNMLAATKKATGMKDLSTLGAKNARVFMESVGAKSALLLSFTFQKDISKGTRKNGFVTGIVTMKAKFLNNRGREVMNKIYVSKTAPLKIMSGQYSKDNLVSALNDSIDATVRQFCADLSEMSGKAEEPIKSDSFSEGESENFGPTPIKMKSGTTPVTD